MQGLQITGFHLRKISKFLTSCLPEEGCGLMIGPSGGTVHNFIPITNNYHSPTRFRMDEKELIRAFGWMDSRNFSLLGIVHSHPNGPDHPSITDLQEYQYPESLMVIFTLYDKRWQSYAYQINPIDQTYNKVGILRISRRV